MRKPIRKSLLYLAVIQAIGTGISLPAAGLSADTGQPSAAAAFAQNRDLQREMIELKNAVVEAPDDAELRFKLGTAYLRLGDAAGAEKELTRARRLGLEDYALWLALGETWIAQGEFRRVFTDDGLLAAQGPDQVAALKTLQGQSLLVQGRTDEARDHFAEALVQVEGYGPALLGIAESELEDGQVIAAQQAMSRARIATDLDPVELLRVEGNLAFALDRFDEAAVYYRQALERRRGDPVLLRSLAVTQLRSNQPEQASRTLDQLLAFNPNSGDALTLKAQAALRMRDYPLAATLAGSAVGAGEDNRLEAFFIAGTASLFNGAPQQAREYLGTYLASQPQDANARRLLGQALLQLDIPGEAYDVMKPLAENADEDVQLLSELAFAAAGAGAMNEAVEYLERATKLDPEDTRLAGQLAAARIATEDRAAGLEQLERLAAENDGNVLFALQASLDRLANDELGAAMAAARTAQQVAPEAVAPRLVQAIALLRAGELDAAETTFAEVLEQQPDNTPARTGMAEIRLRRGEVEQALAQFGKLAADNPDDIVQQLNFAAAEHQAGRSLQAQRRLQQIVADNPESDAARLALANALLASALPNEALAVLAEARHTEDPALLLATGRAELVADRPDDAIRVLERAVALQPSSVDAHLALAAAYRRNEQYARSRVASDTALKISPTNAAARFERLRQVLTDPDASAAELEAAVDDVKQFLAQHPNDPRGSLLRGLSLYRMSGQRDTALARLAQAHQTLRSIDSTVLLADALSFAGKPEEAVKVLEAWVSARPGNNYARLRLAQARLAAGDFDKAATDVATAIENGARRSGLAMMAAWTMAQAGRASEARQFLQQAEAEGAASALVDHTKGRLRLESGDAPGALRLLERATEQYANTAAPPALQLDYARALSGSGKRQAAQNILQNMLAQESLSQHQRDEIQAMLAQLP